MFADLNTYAALPSVIVTFIATVAIELLFRPKPSFTRPWRAWLLHLGVICLVSGALTVIVGNVWLAGGCFVLLYLILILVNNAKFDSLREPFVFQDYEYFIDMLRYPRLYIPFFGWNNFLFSFFLGIVLLYFAFTELAPHVHKDWKITLFSGGIILLSGVLFISIAKSHRLSISFEPKQDLNDFGFIASLWCYALASRKHPEEVSPFANINFVAGLPSETTTVILPHLIAVQSESFFDPRLLYSGICSSMLSVYDRSKAEALAWGGLRVPAWGANTIRTEFSFLSGLAGSRLQAHRFNPYRVIDRGWNVATLASYLRSAGYSTICVHPYHKDFYLRDKVLPRIGFDSFVDIESFTDAQKSGPYIGDVAVAEKILDLLNDAVKPTFIFVITMENHGPLHLEKVHPEDADQLYTTPPVGKCDDLTVYLRHIRNADLMLGRLTTGVATLGRGVEICWYGDHVPIMSDVYAAYGAPDGNVEYLFWSSDRKSDHPAPKSDLSVEELALAWIRRIGLTNS